MVKNNKVLKFAYSLLEASIVLIMVSVIISLSSNVVVSKIKSKTNTKPHGRFECYYVNGELMQHSVINGRDFGVEKSSNPNYCLFKPNQYVKYLVANIVGAGAPYTSAGGGGAGEFVSKFFSSPASHYLLYPGKPVVYNSSALTDEQIKSMKSYITKSIISTNPESYAAIASGGINGTNIFNILPEQLESCHVVKVNDKFDCKVAPGCVISDSNTLANGSSLYHTLKCLPASSSDCIFKDKKITVSYCASIDEYKTVEYNLSDILAMIKSNSEGAKYNKNVLTYYSDIFYKELGCKAYRTDNDKNNTSDEKCKLLYEKWNKTDFERVDNADSPSLFKLELKFNIHQDSKLGEVSELTKYAKSMQFYEVKNGSVNTTSGIAAAAPGDGGSSSSKDGHTGGIVLLY